MQPAKSHKILVVEDEGLIARDISKRLEALGHEVVASVSTAEEALERAAGADLVLMDIRLDGKMDGVEAAAAIRARYHLPVIFLTAHADRGTIERAKAAEPFGYIVKPLAHASLSSSIEVALYKHRVERQIEEREAWLRTTLASVADAVVVTDHRGSVRMLNRAAEELTGWTEQQARGKPISKVVRLTHVADPENEAGEEASEPVALAMLRDAPVALGRSAKLTGAGGREILIEGSAAPVKAAAGPTQTLGAVLIFRDVSARRWEERQLGQVQKMDALARLAFGVSNDYSNLLAIIRNQSDQLLRQLGEYAPARTALDEIRQAAAAADEMSRRLSAFGTRQVSRREEVSLNAILRRTHTLIESVAGPNIEVAIRAQPGAGHIQADSALLEEALMSLVLHACAAMPEGGRLLIETAGAEIPVVGRMAPHTMLAITYTGHEADAEKLFEPSSAGEEGMALSMAHAIAVEHGGYLSARATSGGGCRFEMLLPVATGAALPPGLTRLGAPAILLAGERDAVRLELHNFFEAHGYNFLEAADRDEALAIAEVHEGSLDILIADAGEAGSIAAELRRAHPKLEVLKIVEGEERSADEIRRPFTQRALLERIEGLLAPVKELGAATAL